jgi:hypothetical protein
MNSTAVTQDTDFEKFVVDYLHEAAPKRSHANDYPGIFGLKALYDTIGQESIKEKFGEALIRMLRPNYHNPWSSSEPLVWFATGPGQPPVVITDVTKDDFDCQFAAAVLCGLLKLTQAAPALRRLHESLQTRTGRYDIQWLDTQVGISLSELSS